MSGTFGVEKALASGDAGISGHFAVRPSSASKVIAQGTDWRFLNELKRELKV